MKIAVCGSGGENWQNELSQSLSETLQTFDKPVDLAIAFVSHRLADQMPALADLLAESLPGAQRVGVSAETVIAGDREREGEAYVAVWLASLPDCRVTTFSLDYLRSPDGGAFVGWPEEPGAWGDDKLPGAWGDDKLQCAILLGDPFSFPADVLLDRLAEDRPGLPIVGGMGSGDFRPGGVRLLRNDFVATQGATVIAIAGDLRLDAFVSQGCRPVGEPLVVTKAERNLIFELGGRPAYERLKEIFARLPVRDQKLVRSGLHLGRVVDEYRDAFQAGDFLIRNVLGVDQETGAIQAAEWFRPGQTVQFQVRDAETASQDLQLELARSRERDNRSWAGGLIFDCNGRGTRLFQESDHDALALQEKLGPLPLAGFFAQGEIGPVGGRSFLHGFTASVVLFGDSGGS
jgi:small ligand-binding sensory domain FIST